MSIRVTEVARSRPCPACGGVLMLQVAEKSTGVKRRALLVVPQEAASRETAVPQSLPGQAFDRMAADPALRRLQARLVWGLILVGLLILAAVLSARPVAATGGTPAGQGPGGLRQVASGEG